jgi:hypothetical protein
MPPKTPAPQDAAPAEAPPAVASADDADKNADFAPVNMELPDIQSKFAALYTNLEKEQRARCLPLSHIAKSVIFNLMLCACRRKLDEKRVLDVREYVKTIEDRLDDEIKVRWPPQP